MHNATAAVIRWVEQGRVPDALTRAGIRALLRQRLATLPTQDCTLAAEETRAFVAMMDASPIAAVPELANAQHYELPPSSSWRSWGRGASTVPASGPSGPRPWPRRKTSPCG